MSTKEKKKNTLFSRLLSCAWGPRPVHTEQSQSENDKWRAQTFVDAAELLSQHLQERDKELGPEHLSAEFGNLLEAPRSSRSETAVGASNSKKNRYTNVLPFDYNRVKLKEVDAETDYINASLCVCNDTAVVGMPEGTPCKYVATQGPLNSTTPDFWKMVVQNNLGTIIMLTKTMECKSQRCAQYFPEQLGAHAQHGIYTVTTTNLSQLNADIDVRHLTITWQSDTQAEPAQHEVQHYHYHRWPDHGVPRTAKPLRELSYSLWQQGSNSLAVHCSAGIGRTGTFIAADSLLRRLWALASSTTRVDKEVLKKALDVPSVVCELRLMRSGMVQTAEQYSLVYEVLLEEAMSRQDAPAAAHVLAHTALHATDTSRHSSSNNTSRHHPAMAHSHYLEASASQPGRRPSTNGGWAGGTQPPRRRSIAGDILYTAQHARLPSTLQRGRASSTIGIAPMANMPSITMQQPRTSSAMQSRQGTPSAPENGDTDTGQPDSALLLFQTNPPT